VNVRDLFDLNRKIAVVTGGGRGLGTFIATGLAEAGANVIVASRKLENCEDVAGKLENLGVKSLAVKCDMAVKKDIENLVDETILKFGTIDILVNNAGITWGAPTLEYPLEKWEKVFDVNVKGVWILTQIVSNIMKDNGGGKIINISSVAGFRGTPEEAHPAVAYNSSKAAVNLLTMNLAVKLARYKINVNALAPSFFRTDMAKHLLNPEMKPLLEATLAAVPLGKLGEENDIKAAAVFLASKASDFITGTILPVDGGQLAM